MTAITQPTSGGTLSTAWERIWRARRLVERGVRFVTLQAAMADPFYAADRAAAPSPAPTTLEDAARARGLTPPPKPWSPAAVADVCR